MGSLVLTYQVSPTYDDKVKPGLQTKKELSIQLKV